MTEKTGYKFSASVKDGILEIVIRGEVTNLDLDNLRHEVISVMRENNAPVVLLDNRALKGPNEIATAYFRVRSIPTDIKKIPSAIVERPGNEDFQSFYETTAANTGVTTKYFTDIEAARTWLKSLLPEK